MKIDYHFTLQCSHEGCKEIKRHVYSTLKEYKEGLKKYKTWKCLRHSHQNIVLSKDNIKTEGILICKQLMTSDGNRILGNFWQKEEHVGTNKCESAFMYGNGYRAYADDFEEGTIIKITTEVIFPNSSTKKW